MELVALFKQENCKLLRKSCFYRENNESLLTECCSIKVNLAGDEKVNCRKIRLNGR